MELVAARSSSEISSQTLKLTNDNHEKLFLKHQKLERNLQHMSKPIIGMFDSLKRFACKMELLERRFDDVFVKMNMASMNEKEHKMLLFEKMEWMDDETKYISAIDVIVILYQRFKLGQNGFDEEIRVLADEIGRLKNVIDFINVGKA